MYDKPTKLSLAITALILAVIFIAGNTAQFPQRYEQPWRAVMQGK